MRNSEFGHLVHEGITIVALRQKKTLRGVEHDLTLKLIDADFAMKALTVTDWRQRDIVPRDPAQVAFFVRYCVSNGRLDKLWAERVLIQARYPYPERQKLLGELFPPRPMETIPGEREPRRHNLPPRGQLVGRQGDVERLAEGIEGRWPVVSIQGFAGVGKSTLAIEAGYFSLRGPEAALQKPFESVIWISATDRPEAKFWLTEVLDTIARESGYTPQVAPEQKCDQVEQMLQKKRTLVVIDNYETIEDPELEEWILRVPDPSKILVTSRRMQLPSAWLVPLDGLDESDAVELIRLHARRLKLTELECAEASELLPLVHVTRSNPKAMIMALGYLSRGIRDLPGVVNDLHSASKGARDVFDALYPWHWEALNPRAQHLLFAMSFFVEAVDKDALSAVADLTGYYLDAALEELRELFLLERAEPGADETPVGGELLLPFSLHPLTRAFVSTKLADQPEWEHDARARWVQWYLDFTQRYARGEQRSEHAGGGVSFPHEPVRKQWQNLLAVLAWCAAPERERYEDIKSLWHADRMRAFASVLGHWGDRVYWLEWLIAAAERHDDLAVAVDTMSHLGWTLTSMGQLAAAGNHLARAWQVCEQVDPTIRLTLARHCAWLRIRQKRYPHAKRWLARHTALLSAVLPSVREREAVHLLEYRGIICDETREYPEAERWFQQMLEAASDLQWESACLSAQIRGADVARKQGAYDDARRLLDATLPMAERLDDQWACAFGKRAYALLEQACGHLEAACRWAREAVDEMQRRGLQSETDELREVMSDCCGAGA